MKYQSQRIAYYFFAVSMLLLCLQILYGFIMAFAHVGYDVLHAVIPFNVARATHLNLLVVWLFSGFMGAAHFIIPDETGQELYSTPLAVAQLASLVLVGVIAIIGFHFQWWEGRKFLRNPAPAGLPGGGERPDVHRQHRHDAVAQRSPHHLPASSCSWGCCRRHCCTCRA